MIPHLNALIMDIKIPDKEGRGVIRGLPRPLFVKSVLFRKKGRGKSLMLPRPCPSRILLSTNDPLGRTIQLLYFSFWLLLRSLLY